MARARRDQAAGSDPRKKGGGVMHRGPSALVQLVVVSEDWFARSFLQTLAQDSGHFEAVMGVDDGYSALAEIWEGVARGEPPRAIVIDCHTVGGSVDVLLEELRSDPRTAATYVALIVPSPGCVKPQANLVCMGGPGQPEMARLMEEIAARAGRAIAATTSIHRRR